MKKLMALCLAMLMALSMVSFSVMAEDEVAPATFADVANGQPAKFVVANLVLGEHTITSSNEAVIATDGTVKRPLFEDATVAIAVDGGEATNVTVKAQTVQPLYYNDFSKEAGSSWNLTGNPKDVEPSVVEDGVLKMIIGPTTTARTNFYYYPAALVSNEIVHFAFDVDNIRDFASAGAEIRLNATYYDASGAKIGSSSGTQFVRCSNTDGFGTNWFRSYSKNVTFSYDPMTGEVWGNGSKLNKNFFTDANAIKLDEGKTTDDIAKVVLGTFTITNSGGGCTASFDMDNFVMYQEVPADVVLNNATPAEKAEYYSKYLESAYVAGSANLASFTGESLNFAADEELVEGASLTWTSSNPAVISNAGVVKRPFLEAATVAITGTLSVEGAEPVTATYNVKVLPLVMGFASEIEDAEYLPLGSFVGIDYWTKSIKEWEAMEVRQEANGNKYYSICASSYQPSGTQIIFNFRNRPAKFNAGEKVVFNARVKIPVKAGVGNYGFFLNGKEAAEFVYYNGYLYDNNYDAGNDGYYGGGTDRYDKAVTADRWYDIRLEVYADETSSNGKSSVDCYIDNVLVGSHKTSTAYTAGSDITAAQFVFTGRANMDSTSAPTRPVTFFDIDDMQVYTEKAIGDVLTTLDNADKVAYFQEIIGETVLPDVTAEGQVLALDAKYAGTDLAKYGVAINWASSNTALVSNAGVVTALAPVGTEANINMTAAITAGEASATVVIPVKVTDGTALIKKTDFSDTSAGIGSASYTTDDEAHGSVITLKNDTAGVHKSSGEIAIVVGGGRADRLVFSCDVKYNHNGGVGSAGGVALKTYAGKLGASVLFNYRTHKIYLVSTVPYLNADGVSRQVDISKSIYFDMPQSVIDKGENEWVSVVIDHNPLSQTYNVYVDGVLINDVPLLQADMDLGANGGSAVRGFQIELSGQGEAFVDNVKLTKYTNADAIEVNAALNAALVTYGSQYYAPVLVNQELSPYTIGKSWISGSSYVRDLDGTSIKPSNPSTYKFVENSPAITYTIDGNAVTAVNVTQPKEVELTITASANGITESKTVTRKVAPLSIKSLGCSGAAFNGIWVEGTPARDEKIVVACYDESGKLVTAKFMPFAEEFIGKNDAGTIIRGYNAETGVMTGVATRHPKVTTEYFRVKVFLVDADGITPLTYENAEINDLQ